MTVTLSQLEPTIYDCSEGKREKNLDRISKNNYYILVYGDSQSYYILAISLNMQYCRGYHVQNLRRKSTINYLSAKYLEKNQNMLKETLYSFWEYD